MLEIKGIKKSYGEFQLDCSLNVEKGRITGLVGENGAGKSTLFKAVLGLISYDAGEIKILGKIPEELSEKERRAGSCPGRSRIQWILERERW